MSIHRFATQGMLKFCRLLLILFLLPFLALPFSMSVFAQDVEDHHAESDAYWASLATSYAAFNVDISTLKVAAANELNVLGEWGPVLEWPHIPVSAAHLPDGRILTWASNEEDGFPGGAPEFTYAAAWDPLDGTFKMVPHNAHDMFCAHQVMLEDGRLLVMGGRNTVNLTSIFDPTTDTWIEQEPMANGRWYPTAVGIPNGDVMVAIGSGGGSYPEVWNDDAGWRTLTGVNLDAPILNYTDYYENNWWPLLHVAPDGDVFHSGPTPDMHKINTAGTGSIVKTGPQITDWYPKHGATVMYDEGKLLVAGGAIAGGNLASSNRALTIDINGAVPVVTEVASMHHARKFQNGVMLPTGEVLIVGGNTSGTKFSDDGTVLAAEMWDPETGIWTELTDMAVPRNYHSVALLMTDGRVWVGGGGLCGTGCAANHMDAQVYSPGYLFNPDGTPATRPVINSAPASARNGASISVDATPGLASFSMIKMSSTTHGVNSDVRYLNVPFSEAGGTYDLQLHANMNVLTPGYWMLFGKDANGVPSEAAIIQVSTEGVPQVTSPGTQVSPEGAIISLFIDATDDGALTFTATGLPGGLSMNSGTGEISGTILEGTAGSYDVDITVSDALGSVNTSFTWVVTTGATGQILREWWSGIDGTAIDLLTGDSNYPDNPDGSDFLTSFEAPADWGDNYGTRIRGYIYPPVTGDYTFWISTDDFGELWLSTDENPANTSMIANVPGWANDHDWYKYPEQQSGLVSLQAGERYYVEVLQKEGGGLDNIAVAWQIPGGSLEIIQGGFLSPYFGTPVIDALSDQVDLEGAVVSVGVSATDPDGDAITFTASGLPAGLAMSNDGQITGTISAGAAGDHVVAVNATDGGTTATSFFNWTVIAAADGTGEILREWWSGIDGNEITLLTDDPDFPGTPDGSDLLTSFEAPVNWADSYGTRIHGYVHAPVTGEYTFWISTDDNGELWLSTDDSPDNAALIASVPGWSASQDWFKFPEQQSAQISLVAGQRYYIQLLQKEGAGGDNAAVAWQIPGASLKVIEGGYLSAYEDEPLPIVLADPGNQDGGEGEAVHVAMVVEQDNGLPLTFTATGLPDGLSINASSGVISGGLLPGNAGMTTVTVTVTDGEGTGTVSFNWSVNAARGTWIDFVDDSQVGISLSSVPVTDEEEKDLAVGDLDKDGWDDIIVVRKEGFMGTGAREDLLLMNEAGTLVDRTADYAPGFAAAPTISRDVIIVDLDGDGWDDVLIANTFGGQPSFYRNLGESGGTWLGLADESAARLPTLDTATIQYCSVAAGDVNGDGAPDLYFANYVMDGTTKDVLLINDGNGNFADEGDSRLGNLIDVAFGTQANITDMDGDGDSDIVKLSANQPSGPFGSDGIFILYNDGTGNFSTWSTVPSNDAYMYLIEDFDENGEKDFYIVDDAADYVNLSSGITANTNINFTQQTTPWVRTAGHGANLRAGDLDRDGDLDIGVADVDTSVPPCLATDMRAFVLLENENDASGTFIDPFGAADKPWSKNMYDFAFVDVNKDGNLDIFTAECGGYGLYSSTQDPVEPPAEPVTLALGDLRLGIAAHDQRQGDGYIMYSAESVHTRFADTPPSAWSADHLIAVVFDNGTWKIDRNKNALVPFTVQPSDRLVAEVDFGADTVNHLTGVSQVIEGINAGYVSGDLVITPEMWNGTPNAGEFGLAGTEIVVSGEGLNASPVLAAIGDQSNTVGDVVSITLSATDADGDAVTFDASGLPSGVDLNGNEIAGSPTTAGTYTATVTANDGNGGVDSETINWTVDGGTPSQTASILLGDLNNGIAAHDPRTGSGYIMYSEESIHTRFADNPPSAWNADHLIAVVLEGGQWKIDRNKGTLVNFTPRATDHLVAEVDFGADTVTHLIGANTVIDGINAGYVSGDLVITAEMWAGSPNEGEFGVEGTSIEIPVEVVQSARARDQLKGINEVPEQFALVSIYPNPFSRQTAIAYQLAEESDVKIEIYSITGQRVRILMDRGLMPAGNWQTIWDGTDDGGRGLAAGVYMVRFEAGAYSKTGKVVLVK